MLRLGYMPMLSGCLMAKSREHDKTAVRLAQILLKLNQGEKLDPRQLAGEFQVSLRTIQRDLLERFSYLPLKKDNGLFYLEAFYLGKLNLQDIERFFKSGRHQMPIPDFG